MLKYIKFVIVRGHSLLRKVARFFIRNIKKEREKEVARFSPISKDAHIYRVENYLLNKNYNNKVAFITAITGGYEELKFPEFLDRDIDYYVFTDSSSLEVYEPFTKVVMDKYEEDPTRLARWVKLNHYKILRKYDYIIWVDSNLLVRNSLMNYVKDMQANQADFGMFKHPARSNLKQEVEACQRLSKDSFVEIQDQYDSYKTRSNINELNLVQLYETNVYITNMNSDNALQLLKDWYRELFLYSRRDQLALPMAIYKNKQVKIHSLEWNESLTPRFNKFTFEIFKHSDKETYIKPSYLKRSMDLPLSTLEIANVADVKLINLVSIVVPVYNAPEEVSQLLVSIKNQESTKFELILVDDGSNIETKKVLESFTSMDDSVCVISHDVNKGYTTTVNDGLLQASGDLIVVLNSDTVLPKKFVGKLIEYANSNPHISAFGPITNAGSWQNTPNLVGADGKLAINTLPNDMDVDTFNEQLQRSKFANTLVKVNLLNGFCYAVRKSTYDAMGFLDVESFPSGYGEEDDFFIRLNLDGYQAAIMQGLYVYHHKTKSFTSEQKNELCKIGQTTLHSKYSKFTVVRLVKNSSKNPALEAHRQFINSTFYRE
jgi:O-antigen biosynthesis protein